MQSKKKLILVIGPPGVGKGTQSKLLAERTGKLHISTGDFIRKEIKNQTDVGKMIEPFVKKDALIPDDIIIKVIIKLLDEQDGSGVILDGFPRTLSQGLAIKTEMEVEMVILLQASDDVCVKRILSRQLDPNSGRKVDDEKQIKERLKFFNDSIGEICDLFKDKIQVINGSDDLSQVSASIEQLFLKNPLSSINKNIDKNLKISQSEQSCVICMMKPADHLVVPCGHQCGCQSCLSELFKSSGTCPICKKIIVGFIHVYRSGVVENENIENSIIVKNKNNNDKNNNVIEEAKNLENDKNIEKNLVISVAPCEEIVQNKMVNVAISINIPDTPVRKPIDVCCVIDISGSMGENATFQDPEDETKTKSDGMSVLDLVKHAVKTVIHTLTDQDRLSIVEFETNAKTSFPLTVMSEKGRTQAVMALEELVPKKSTNIWAGLETGLESLRTAAKDNHIIPRKKFLYLLTDGQPKISPGGGEDQALKHYFESHPHFQCQVNTFGFGYKLKSSLLLNIGTVGGGMFSFIPDAKIVGTNFVNAIANAATTLTQNATLHLIPKKGSSFAGNVGGMLQFEKKNSGHEVIVKLGNLQYGKGRDIVIPMIISTLKPDYLEVILEYDEINSQKINYIASNREKTADSVAAYVRNLVVSESYQIIKDCRAGHIVKGMKSMKTLSEKVSAYDIAAENNDARLRGLFSDLVGNGEKGGRMSKAVSTNERFIRWGEHYLSTITRAHQLQLCTNFIDLGLQVYGGVTFFKLQELGGNIFLTLPMTIMKRIVKENINNQPVINPVNNADYYGGDGGGCFDESCLVTILENTGKLVKKKLPEVKKNDFVSVIDNNEKQCFARVLCVVQVNLGRPQKMIEFPATGLKITQKHPIWFNNQWKLPVDIENRYKNIACFSEKTPNIVYNFVLEHSHVLLVNDIRCVTLGHEIKNAFHPFYGTSAVINVLKALPGFENGFVQVKGSISKLTNSKKLNYEGTQANESKMTI